MNKRIKELAEQCTSIPNHLNPPVFDQEKFAELIVKECASVADAGNAVAVASVIRERFGIEQPPVNYGVTE